VIGGEAGFLAMAEPADINVDELRRRARRRLVGAVVLALGVAVIVPMLLETEQKPLGDDVSVKIPPVDEGRFVNRLTDQGDKAGPDTAPSPSAAPSAPPAAPAAPGVERSSKYDTHVSQSASNATTSSTSTAPPESARPARPTESAVSTPSKADPANVAPERASAATSASTVL
jgi:DedD protein